MVISSRCVLHATETMNRLFGEQGGVSRRRDSAPTSQVLETEAGAEHYSGGAYFSCTSIFRLRATNAHESPVSSIILEIGLPAP